MVFLRCHWRGMGTQVESVTMLVAPKALTKTERPAPLVKRFLDYLFVECGLAGATGVFHERVRLKGGIFDGRCPGFHSYSLGLSFTPNARGHMSFLRGRPILVPRSASTNRYVRALPVGSRLLDPLRFVSTSPSDRLRPAASGPIEGHSELPGRPTQPFALPCWRQTTFGRASSHSRRSTPSAPSR